MSLRHTLRVTDSNVQVAAAVTRKVVDLVGRLRVNQTIPADKVERTMRLLDTGQLDELMVKIVPESEPAAPERYVDIKPFDHDAWKARHGSK